MDNIIYAGVGLLAILMAHFLFKYLVTGAIFLFAYAAEQGFIGVAAYVACWVFLFPVMLIASIITGYSIAQ